MMNGWLTLPGCGGFFSSVSPVFVSASRYSGVDGGLVLGCSWFGLLVLWDPRSISRRDYHGGGLCVPMESGGCLAVPVLMAFGDDDEAAV
ncbi:hypothetical protein Bca4012_054998 [Brassica carinata]